MVYGYSWYLAMTVSPEVATLFSVGGSYDFSFPENGGCEIALNLESRAEGTGEVLLVFRSNSTPAGFDYHRVQRVEITVDTCEGYYVPESALQWRRADGVEEIGVYVFENSVIRFRRIEVLYYGDGYCIVASGEESEITELKKNDILVTSGKNLYDGKGYQ